MVRSSDFEKLLFFYKTEGKEISLEQYSINNGFLGSVTFGTTSSKNETAL